MTSFDKLYRHIFERLIYPGRAIEWVPDPEEVTIFNWPGVAPENWKGPAIQNNIFNANNAGPFVLTTQWLKDYKKCTQNVKNIVDKSFKKLLNNPNRSISIEIKKALGLGRTIINWQIGHDVYMLFEIHGPNREVYWTNIFDDHDAYNHYLKTSKRK